MTAKPVQSITRRAMLGAGAGCAAGAAVAWALWPAPSFDGDALSVRDAFSAARRGEIVLVDIRRPDEWSRTGIGVGAHPIDMRSAEFSETLSALVGKRKDVPVALICARGVRSARLSRALTEAGYSHVINIPEGMLGSDAGPGWIETGLPVTAYDG